MRPWVPEVSQSTRSAKPPVVAPCLHRVKSSVPRGESTVQIILTVVLMLRLRITGLSKLALHAWAIIVQTCQTCWSPLHPILHSTGTHISSGNSRAPLVRSVIWNSSTPVHQSNVHHRRHCPRLFQECRCIKLVRANRPLCIPRHDPTGNRCHCHSQTRWRQLTRLHACKTHPW